jgi:hypothetical protein
MRNLVTRKYTRVRKNVARKLFNEGRIIYLTPSNIVATDSSPWIKPYPINNRAGDNFDDIVNRYEFYNCNYELGYYTNFWISEEKETTVKKIEVVIIEAGLNYTNRLESFEMELPEDRARAVAEAIKAVKARGYNVIPNDQGGCNEYSRASYGEDSIAITVAPSAE